MLDRDRETRDDDSRTLIFETLALIVRETVPADRIARDELIRALAACAAKTGPQERADLKSALEAVGRYRMSD